MIRVWRLRVGQDLGSMFAPDLFIHLQSPRPCRTLRPRTAGSSPLRGGFRGTTIIRCGYDLERVDAKNYPVSGLGAGRLCDIGFEKSFLRSGGNGGGQRSLRKSHRIPPCRHRGSLMIVPWAASFAKLILRFASSVQE